MTPEPHALQSARELLGHLPGWQLADETIKRLTDESDSLPTWANITEPSTGITVTINTTQAPTMLLLSARYPKDYEPYIHGRGRVNAETIKVGRTKPPRVIAADLMRRLITPEFRELFLARLDVKRKSENQQARDEQLAGELRELLGDPFANRRSDSPEGRRTFRLVTKPSYRMRLEGSVAHGVVDMKLQDLTPALAKHIISLVTGGS